jgi:hypothetical protein
MPLQNKVWPDGEIVADPHRGLIMGNRGCLHGHGRELGVSRWRSKLWIACVLDWRRRQRDPMPPGRWTALFFLDEATALAAGHRPCGYCRRADYVDFGAAWRAAQRLPRRLLAVEMDARLHAERVDRRRRKLTRRRDVGELPEGVMIRHAGAAGLVVGGMVRPWSPAGYGPAGPVPPGTAVDILTPPSIVAAIGAGYGPLLHPSALASDQRAGWVEEPGLRGQWRREARG